MQQLKLGLRLYARACMAIVIICVVSASANAIPRFSLLTGTRCSACHFNPQGSGIRTELGWQMMNATGLFQWKSTKSDEFASQSSGSNTLFNRTLIPGLDTRLQLVRLSSTGQELLIPMQITTSLAVMPTKTLSIYGGVNIATVIEDAVMGPIYPGMSEFDAAIQYQPSIVLPSIRVGMIQPSIGIRQDDHTEFVRREPSINNIVLIPPDYNEVGAEVTYEGMKWLTVNAGIYNAHNLSRIDATVGPINSYTNFSKPSMSARVVLWPQLLDQGLNGELGGSIYTNGAFKMMNAFAGIGIADKATFYVEGMYSKNADQRIIRNFSIIGTYQLVEWLSMDWRYDWGQTEVFPGKALAYSNAFLAGFEFFPFPFIEIRPEYRIMQTNPFFGVGTYTAQYTGQIHVFY